MTKKLAEKITARGFDDFKIIGVKSNDKQLYLLRDSIESKRTIESLYYDVTVYADHKSAGKKLRSEYNFIYKPGGDLNFHLEQAKFACSLVKNRHYDLLRTVDPPNVEVLDPRLDDPTATGADLADTIYKSARGAGVRLSSAEIYLKRSEITLKTSTGIECRKIKGLIEIEITLIGSEGAKEQEMNFQVKRRRIDDLRLQERIAEYVKHTINTLNVKIPNSGKSNVLFNAADIYGLMSPIIFHSSGRAKDQGMSRFNPNEAIVDQSENDLTIKTSGIIPFGLYSDPFDDDGIPGQEHTIVDRGIFKKHWTTKRYADYLGVEPTGSFKNLVIEPASDSSAAHDNYYEIVQFSDLSPDPITGDLVAEIRFGYHVQNGKRTPIKGGSVGCNVFEALKNTYFSRDTTFEGRYLGPKFIILKDLSISGQ